MGVFEEEKRPLDVVVVFAFDCTSSTPDYISVCEVYRMVQKKLVQFPGSCLSYIYVELTPKRYRTHKGDVAADGSVNSILKETKFDYVENMASGLAEAHNLINRSAKNPRGIILLFSNGFINENKGPFFDKAEDYVSTFPVHTFALGSNAYNAGLCKIAANSPGGTFNSITIPNRPEQSLPLSLLLDSILSGRMTDDEEPPTLNSESMHTNGLVSIKEVKYSKDDAAQTAVTAEVEIQATSSTAVREGLDLVVVLDVSCHNDDGKAAKIENLKNAMKFVITKLTAMDRLSIITFSDGAARLNPLRCMTPAAQKEFVAIVDGLSVSARGSSGGTNIKAGLGTGLAVIADRGHTTGRTASVFLVSDEKQTVGGDASEVDPGKVAVHTFAVGGDSDHQLLSNLAAKSSGGTFSAVADGAKLSVALSQLLGGLLTVVAQDVQLRLTPNADVVDTSSIVVARRTDYDTHSIDDVTGAITINFGSLFAGEVRKVVFTLGVKGSNATHAALVEAHCAFTAQGKVQRQDEDVKKEKEIAAKRLAAISDLAHYLRNAIEALQDMQRIMATSA